MDGYGMMGTSVTLSQTVNHDVVVKMGIIYLTTLKKSNDNVKNF